MQENRQNEFYHSTLNSLFLLETRTDPTLCGLTVLNLRDGIPFDTQFICWFPPDFRPCQLVVNPVASAAVIRCEDGVFSILIYRKFPFHDYFFSSASLYLLFHFAFPSFACDKYPN
jgi:hypothetical protein